MMNWISAEVVGVDVDLIDTQGLIDEVMEWQGAPRIAMGVNAHVCNMVSRSEEFASLVQGVDLRYPDGQSIVWAARLSNQICRERVATTDLVFPLAERCAAERKRMFLFGSEPRVVEAAAERLRRHAPGLEVASSHGYVSSDEMAALIERINEFDPHVVLVGLGDPMQQRWAAAHRADLRAPAILTCGGLFDWLSGRHPRPPARLVDLGLEWLWRLYLEPRRLGRRYLIGNPVFVAHLAVQLFRARLPTGGRIAF